MDVLSENMPINQRVIAHGYFIVALLALFSEKVLSFPLIIFVKLTPELTLLILLRYLTVSTDIWSRLFWAILFSLAGSISASLGVIESLKVSHMFFGLAALTYLRLISLHRQNIQSRVFTATIVGLFFIGLSIKLSLEVTQIFYILPTFFLLLLAISNASLNPLTLIGTLLFFLAKLPYPLINSDINSLGYMQNIATASYYMAQFCLVYGIYVGSRNKQPSTSYLTTSSQAHQHTKEPELIARSRKEMQNEQKEYQKTKYV